MRYLFMFLAAFTAVLTVAAIDRVPAAIVAQDIKDARKTYDDGKREWSATKMERGVGEVAAVGGPDALKFLLGELAYDQKERAKARGGKPLPGGVRTAVVNALSGFSDEPSVKLIGEAALKMDSAKDPALALDQLDFFKALAANESPAAEKPIKDALAHESNPYLKVAALEAVRSARAAKYFDDVLAVLADDRDNKKKFWTDYRIVPINAFDCLNDIVDAGNNEQVVKTVFAVVDLAKHCEASKIELDERVRYFAGRMLFNVTGERADMMSHAFWNFWAEQKKLSGNAPKAGEGPRKQSKTKPPTPVFNAPPVGTRYVFVIDVSESMNLPLKITLPEIEKRKPEGPTSGRHKKDGEGGEGQPEEKPEEPEQENPLRKLPWKDLDTKMKLARAELARAIEALPDGYQFAIVTYSREVKVLTGGFVKSNSSTRANYASQARKLEPESLTNIHGGLMAGLRLSVGMTYKPGMPPEPAIDRNCVINGADTIIFMTDGWGSWSDDSTSQDAVDKRRKDGKGLVGNGSFIYGEDIWPDIVRRNVFRKVIINTVGIGNHDKDCLRQIAKNCGGTYVDWSFPE